MKSLVEGKLSAAHQKEMYMQKLSAAALDLASRVQRVEDSAAAEWAVVQAELARGEADQLAERR